MKHLRPFRVWLVLVVLISLVWGMMPAAAQDEPFPLPAPLYILTPDQAVVRIDPASGEQTLLSPEGQPVADFAIAPGGAWYAYRTSLNNAVIVAETAGMSGFVLAFDIPLAPENAAGQTIAWSPDAARLAYLVPDGVSIAELGAGEFGDAAIQQVGGAWVDLHWAGPDTLLAQDTGGQWHSIQPQNGTWAAVSVESEPPDPQPVIGSLGANGVQMENGQIVPGTAGARAFEWGPEPPPVVAGVPMPADLTYLAPDQSGVDQVWWLPQSGEPARMVTDSAGGVSAYAVAPGGAQIATIAGGQLVAARLDGSDRRELASLLTENTLPAVNWSHDGTQLAYHDQRGVWIVPADGSQAPRLLLQSQFAEINTRVYLNPRWSPDGARLLVTIGFYEGAIQGVADVATGAVTDLQGVSSTRGRWIDDGRVLVWSAFYGYEVPGLYLLDPANPQAPPQTVLDESVPVVDVRQAGDGTWYVLAASSGGLGPQFLRLLAAPTLQGPFERVYDGGGFAEGAQIVPPGDSTPAMMAGLRQASYVEGVLTGDLVVNDLRSGEQVQIAAPRPVHHVQWVN
ncbi:MAG: hypothetical protein GXY36_15990 [Chloroflexi bacterium]|nr:hypothetical protein [Chloroflexota bacterium]